MINSMAQIEEKSKIQDETHEKQLEALKNKINDINAKGQEFENGIKQNVEKIIQMEEDAVNQKEKAKYFETLNERLTVMDEAKQQSEAKTKEELEEKFKLGQDALESFKVKVAPLLSPQKSSQCSQSSLMSLTF